MKWHFKHLIFALILMFSVGLFAEQIDEVRMDLQVNLFLKILKYDRNIAERGKNGLKLGVLYNPASKKSTKAFKDFQENFNQIENRTVNGIQVFLIPIKGYEALSSSVKSYGVNIVYIASGFDSQLDDILSFCRSNKILTLTGVPKYAEKGVAVGLGIKMKKPQIIINNPVAKELGANFSADILKLAKVIK